MQSIEDKILSRIYGRGRGWAFSQKDLVDLGRRSAVDLALHRAVKKGKIRRVIRGIYDYPKFSKRLNQVLSPNIDQVAQAIARKSGWRIQPGGPAALNIIGLSTQVPAKQVYFSDGPDRLYVIDKTHLAFKHASKKEIGFRHYESGVIVRALRALGPDRITPSVIAKIKAWLAPRLRSSILRDTQTVSGWIYESIRLICTGEADG